MRDWGEVWNSLKSFFANFGDNFVEYILQFLLLSIIFYFIFKVLKNNKGGKFIAVIVFFILLCGVTFTFSKEFANEMLFLIRKTQAAPNVVPANGNKSPKTIPFITT